MRHASRRASEGPDTHFPGLRSKFQGLSGAVKKNFFPIFSFFQLFSHQMEPFAGFRTLNFPKVKIKGHPTKRRPHWPRNIPKISNLCVQPLEFQQGGRELSRHPVMTIEKPPERRRFAIKSYWKFSRMEYLHVCRYYCVLTISHRKN